MPNQLIEEHRRTFATRCAELARELPGLRGKDLAEAVLTLRMIADRLRGLEALEGEQGRAMAG